MREIGSEFWNVSMSNIENKFFPESAQWYLSGRSALQAIIKELHGVRSVSLPSWCCDSMIKPFLDAGFEVGFYPVYWQEGLKQEINLDSDVLFVMDYFGYTALESKIQNYKGIVIRDVTHSIFSATYSDADYYFGSLRKWCGVWTGGYAWAADRHSLPMEQADDLGYASLREKAMQMKSRCINNYGETDKSYLKIFDEAEELLDHMNIAPAADRDVWVAKKLDVDYIRNRRSANAGILRAAFSDWLVFPQLAVTDTPLFVPVLVPNGKRNELRQFLIENKIYCPVHWPVSEYHRLSKREKFIYDNALSLVCDQRYTEEDMYRVVEIINQFWKET